jgi:pSer/pThr/pTyr-binding forkhead associated (FHA) protein
MSAILVLILRILLIANLYAFLTLTLIFLYHEMRRFSGLDKSKQVKNIVLNLLDEPARVFSKSEILIGRDPDCDLQLQDDNISNRHARIFYSKGKWMIEDSKSDTGIYLNNQKILTPTILKENDLICVGIKEIRVSFQKSSN